VNNAGLNFLGDAELTTMDQFVNQVSINQLGVVRVTKAFLPEIRQRKGSKSGTYFLIIRIVVGVKPFCLSCGSQLLIRLRQF